MIGVPACRQIFQRSQVFFPPATGIVYFNPRIVANFRHETLVEECTVVSELRQFVAIFKALRNMRNREGHIHDLTRGERLLKRINRIESPGRTAHQMKWPIEFDLIHCLVLIRNMDLRDWGTTLVLESEFAGGIERSPLRIDIYICLDRSNLRLGKILVPLEVLLVGRLDIPPVLRRQIFIPHMSVVKVPAPSTGREQQEENRRRRERRCTAQRQPGSRTQRIIRAAPGIRDGHNTERCKNRKPVRNRPEKCRNEMAVAIHV